MTRNVVGLYVWKGMAYLPAQAQYKSGIWVDVEPVIVSPLNFEELKAVIAEARAIGHSILPDPTPEDWRKRKDPTLEATQTRSWKELARTGASYNIDFHPDHVRIDMSRLDKKERWEFDPNKVQILPHDTSLEVIIDLILSDIRSRPELWQNK